MMPFSPKKFVFLAGAEGSGTTLLLRLLSAPTVCSSIGYNHTKVPPLPGAEVLAEKFSRASVALWDRKLSFREHEDALFNWQMSLEEILASEAYREQQFLVFKQSFPYEQPRDRYTPDIWDALELLPNTQIVVIYRDPRAATYSAFRRGFDSDLRRLAVGCAEQLTWIAGQVQAIGPDRVSIVSYSALCSSPRNVMAQLCQNLGIPPEEILSLTEMETINSSYDDRFSSELDHQDELWLNDYFNDRRCAQWKILD